MNKLNFKQGMSHSEALSYSLGYGGLVDDEARSNYVTSYTSLKDRPDYDGYLTKDELIHGGGIKRENRYSWIKVRLSYMA